MIRKKEITSKAAKKIIEEMPLNKKGPREIATEMGLIGIIDESEVIRAVEQAIRENPGAVEDYHAGKEAAINFLVGQVMRMTRGKAEPERTVELIKERI
jgi:aspartyl-tRNA(Asn)/glutamyl-tRNA(Gln) amidotransferase subunit B